MSGLTSSGTWNLAIKWSLQKPLRHRNHGEQYLSTMIKSCIAYRRSPRGRHSVRSRPVLGEQLLVVGRRCHSGRPCRPRNHLVR